MPRYEITVEGVVSEFLAGAFEKFGFRLVAPARSHLVGELEDQVALNGFLSQLQDLRVEVLELRRLDPP